MNISIESISQQTTNQQWRITVPAEQVSAKLNEAMEKLAKTVELKGFRKGHVPLSHIKQRYGDAIVKDLVSELITETSRYAIEEKALQVAMQPKTELESEPKQLLEGANLQYKMTVEVVPDFTLIDLATITLERITTDLKEEHVFEALQAIAQQNPIFESDDAKRPAQKNDKVIVDITGTLKGKAFENNETKDMVIQLGHGQLHEMMEKALIGKNAGDQFNIPIGFPPDHPNKMLAGQLADFSLHLKAVHAQREPKIDDVFAKAMGAENVEALRKKVREEMERADQETARAGMKQQISEALLNHQFELPPTVLAQEQKNMMTQIETMRSRALQSKQDSANQEWARTDMNKVKQNVKVMAENRLRVALVLSRIAREHHVEVSSQEVQAAIQQDIKRYSAHPEQIKKIYQEHPEIAQTLYTQILEEKTIDAVIKMAKIKDKHVNRRELYKKQGQQRNDKQILTDLLT